MNIVTVGQVARKLSVPGFEISNLFYRGHLNEKVCPVVSGRRLIPEDYVPEIACELRRIGKMPPLSHPMPISTRGGRS